MFIFNMFISVLIGVTYEQKFTSNVLPVKKNHLIFGKNEYYFGTTLKVNFFQASRLCKAEEMELVHIESREENERLSIFATQLNHGHEHFWTSGNNLHNFQEWAWLSTGLLFTYTNWYPGEPNLDAHGSGFTERCMEARTLDKGGFSWNNVPCDRNYYYICKRSKSNGCSKKW